MTAGSGKMRTGMSCVVQGPSLHERCRFCLNDKKILSQEAHDLWKRPMGFSFFFHGLGSSLITRGNMGDSRGVVKTNLIKALLETRDCRWISYSNSKQYS